MNINSILSISRSIYISKREAETVYLTADLFWLVSALFVQDLVADLLGNVLALHVGPHAALLQLDGLTLLSGCPPGEVTQGGII